MRRAFGGRQRPAFSAALLLAAGGWLDGAVAAEGSLPPPRLLAPIDAVIVQNDPEAGCPSHEVMGYGHQVEYRWEAVAGAREYQVEARRAHARYPAVDTVVPATTTRLLDRSCNSYVLDINGDRWQWRVRSVDEAGQPGEWSDWAGYRFAPCRLADGRTCGTDPPPEARGLIRLVRGTPPELAAPQPVSPPDGATFWHLPRETQLAWARVPGAVHYDVYVDCLHCCRSEAWCSDVNGLDSVRHRVTEPTYSFGWYGAQAGRWRVRAIGADGEPGPVSPWWVFKYAR